MKIFVAVFFALAWSYILPAQSIPTPTQTDEIIIDNGASGKADPNDRIRYKVTIQNTGGSNANGVQLNIVPDPRTTFVAGTFRSSPLAVPDAYACTGNVGINISAANGVKSNDFDDNTAGLTITAETKATAQAGSVMIAADGSFMYTPPAGFTGSDNFTYTLNDGNGVGAGVPATDVGTVTITVSNLIWFIDNSSMAATSDGRLTSPFKTLADFNAGSTPVGDLTYIEHTGTNYTGGIVLQDNERVYGEGHTGGANLANVLPFSLAANSKALPNINGNRPIITNSAGPGILLGSNNVIRGVEAGCNSISDYAIRDNGGTVGNLGISDVNINNATSAFRASNGGSLSIVFSSIITSGGNSQQIFLVNTTGSFAGGAGSINTGSGAGLWIDNGTVAFDYNGSITCNTSNRLAYIINHSTGLITLDGNLSNMNSLATGIYLSGNSSGTISFNGTTKTLSTGSNTAITLINNTGATINFSGGGLVITTSSGTGFSATGGGTVSVTKDAGTDNTINSTAATALNVTSTTIGSGGLNFLSISSNNASKGIVLNTTGNTAGLTVTGTGTTDGSGGTIQNMSTRGGEFISTINLSLKNMSFTNANTSNGGTCTDLSTSGCNAAIYLSSVNTVTLDNINITGTTAQQGINGLTVSNFTLSNSTITNTGNEVEEGCIKLRELTGTCAITNCDLAFPGQDVVEIVNTTGPGLLLNVNTSSFRDSQSSGSGGNGLQVRSQGSASVIFNVNTSNFLRLRTNGIQATAINSANNDVDVTGSTFDTGTGTMIGLDLDADNNGVLKFNVQNNPIVYARNGPAINVFGDNNAVIDGRINNNPDVQVKSNPGGSQVGSGIRANLNKDASGRIEVKNNVVNIGSDDAGIDLTGIGKTTANPAGATKTLNATVTGNNVTIGATSTYGIFIISASNATDNNAICVNVANNSVIRNPSSIASFRARVPSASGFFFMEGFNTNAENTWNIKGNMPTSSGGSEVSFGGSGTFGSCTTTLPSNPPLSPSN